MNYSTKKNSTSWLLSRRSIVLMLSLLVASILVLILASTPALAKQKSALYTLQLMPKQCVAMHQGQNCYADVKISWQAEQLANYCLYSSEQAQALQCWLNSSSADFFREMVISNNIQFSLREQGKNITLISKELEIAWVYKKNTRNNISWRKF